MSAFRPAAGRDGLQPKLGKPLDCGRPGRHVGLLCSPSVNALEKILVTPQSD
jgi:hypothetical protein